MLAYGKFHMPNIDDDRPIVGKGVLKLPISDSNFSRQSGPELAASSMRTLTHPWCDEADAHSSMGFPLSPIDALVEACATSLAVYIRARLRGKKVKERSICRVDSLGSVLSSMMCVLEHTLSKIGDGTRRRRATSPLTG